MLTHWNGFLTTNRNFSLFLFLFLVLQSRSFRDQERQCFLCFRTGMDLLPAKVTGVPCCGSADRVMKRSSAELLLCCPHIWALAGCQLLEGQFSWHKGVAVGIMSLLFDFFFLCSSKMGSPRCFSPIRAFSHLPGALTARLPFLGHFCWACRADCKKNVAYFSNPWKLPCLVSPLLHQVMEPALSSSKTSIMSSTWQKLTVTLCTR